MIIFGMYVRASVFFFFFFFFSSRRRHTSFDCDWSSDVCSSDLALRDAFEPVALNFWRWLIAALVLAPFALPELARARATLRRHAGLLALLEIGRASCRERV